MSTWHSLPAQRVLVAQIIASFQKLAKTPISTKFATKQQILASETPENLAILCRDAPFALLAHDGTPKNLADAKFIYANRFAQELFEYPLEQLLSMPSASSAEAPDRSSRHALLAATAGGGFVEGYVGVRVKKSGKRFKMHDGMVWNVYKLNDDGTLSSELVGQAAAFSVITPEPPAS